jgi:CxxC-x17-CxxC domain-containing protein
MKNFQPGGLRNRRPDLGGRPHSDVNKYAPKGRFDDHKPRFDKRAPHAGGRDKGASESFQATCTTCGKSCDVPFRPDGIKPVLCRDCYARKSGANIPVDSPRGYTRPETGPAAAAQTEMIAMKKQLNEVQNKLDEVLALLRPQTPAAPEVPEEVAATEESKKPAKKAPAKKATAKKAPAKKVVKKKTK